MRPIIISAKETTTLSPSRQVISAVEVQWTYGNLGPFKLTTTWTDLQSGKALADITQRAAALQALPTA